MSDDKVTDAVKSVRDFVNGHIATRLLAGAGRMPPGAPAGMPEDTWFALGILCAAAESTLLAPMMPPKATPEMIASMVHAHMTWPLPPGGTMERIYDSIYRHLTKQNTKTAQVWRAEYCTAQTDGTWLPQCQQFHTIEQRDERVKFMSENPQWYSHIVATGPHDQTVPA